MAKTKRVRVEWNGPTYSVPVNGGKELFAEEGVWDYGMHVKGDTFVVYRSDAEKDRRFIILEGVTEADAHEDEDEIVVTSDQDQQPPDGEHLQAEADKSIPEVKEKLAADKAKKK